MGVSVLLSELLTNYLQARDLEEGSARHLQYVLARFHRWLRRSPRTSDLVAARLNAWLESLLADSLSRSTVKGYRGAMLCLWRFAYETGALKLPPARVRPVKVPRRLPTAWTVAEVNRLLAACALVAGGFRFHDLTYRDYLRALVLVAWDTGLRLGDLLALRSHQLSATGVLAIVQHKTGMALLCQLRTETMAAVTKLPPDMFGIIGRGRVFELFGELKRHAGLNGHDKTKGIRKAGATIVEATFPGQAGVFLGHLTPGLAYRHYVDPRHLQQNRPTTPALRLRSAPSERSRPGRDRRRQA